MEARASYVAAIVASAAMLATFRTTAVACQVHVGQIVILASQELDPDVFLWDSRDRLTRYAQGDYSVQMVLRHTILVPAYAHAVVTGCQNTAIRPPYAGSSDPAVDLVGVKVTSGTSRGRFGWVLSSDVRRPDGSPFIRQNRPD